jgi:4-hydroxythreonine-4-phosphate dehydrogenase
MIKKAENIIVGISIGDLNGIGSEVILKTFEDTRMLELCTPVIFAKAYHSLVGSKGLVSK